MDDCSDAEIEWHNQQVADEMNRRLREEIEWEAEEYCFRVGY